MTLVCSTAFGTTCMRASACAVLHVLRSDVCASVGWCRWKD